MLKVMVASMVVVMLIVTGAAAKDGFTVTPIKGGYPTMVGTDARAPGDECVVGITDAYWAITGWLLPPEEYAVYSDPADCDDCSGGWEPLGVSIMLQSAGPCTLTLSGGIRDADFSVPSCPVPGAVVCWSLVYAVTLPEAGLYVVGLPLDAGCEIVDGPFFSAIRFEDDPAHVVLPELVTDDVEAECVSYNDWGTGWQDTFVDIGFPGSVTISAILECQADEYYMDIKPGSCPNPLNVKSRGVLPVAFLGTEDFDVTQIDPATIMLACTAQPLRWSYSDVATPVGPDAELCECTEEGPDGFLDLTVKFATQDVVAAIAPFDDGDEISVMVSATLLDGTVVVFDDCVWIIDKTRESTRTALEAPDNSGVLRESTEPTTWGTIKALYR